MTLEQLKGCDASTLEAMTDEELLKHFEPYLNITRPERNVQSQRTTKEKQVLNPKLAQGVELLKSLGVDVGSSLVPYKKRRV